MMERAMNAPATAKPTLTSTPTPSDPTKKTGSLMAAGAPFQITPVTQRDRFLKTLFYGRPGVGKTTLAGSAADVPDMQDVLFVDAESGDLTIMDNPRIKRADRIFHVRIENFRQVAFIQEFLLAHCKARDANDPQRLRSLQSKATGIPVDEIADEDLFRFRTVVVDSMTEVDQYCVHQILGTSQDIKQQLDAESIEVAGWPEFRKNNQMIQLLVRAYRDLKMHVILVCAQQYVQDEQKVMHFTPALTGRLSSQIQGFVDIVGYLTAGKLAEGQTEAARRLYVQPVGKFDAKCRRASFRGSYIDDPTMGSILKAVGLLK
jgi:hypothetical protein